MNEQDSIKAHVKSVIDNVKNTLLFEDDAIDQPVNLKTMDPRDPDNSVLRNFGTLFIIASTRRLNDTFLPGAEIVSSLATYERLALGIEFDSDELLNIHQQNIAESICLCMRNLQGLISKGGDKGAKCSRLGRGIARVFGTYYAGMEAFNERASPVGRGLVVKLAMDPPFSSWTTVFARAVRVKIACRAEETHHEEGRSTRNESTACSMHTADPEAFNSTSSGDTQRSATAVYDTSSVVVNPTGSNASMPLDLGSAAPRTLALGTIIKSGDGTASEDPKAVKAFQKKLGGLTQGLNDALDQLSFEIKGGSSTSPSVK